MEVCKTMREFQKKLREAIESQSMDKFKHLVANCPFTSKRNCLRCGLLSKDGINEFTGPRNICLLSEMSRICWDYIESRSSRETVLARLVLIGTKLLAYLENKV